MSWLPSLKALLTWFLMNQIQKIDHRWKVFSIHPLWQFLYFCWFSVEFMKIRLFRSLLFYLFFSWEFLYHYMFVTCFESPFYFLREFPSIRNKTLLISISDVGHFLIHDHVRALRDWSEVVDFPHFWTEVLK